MPTIPHSRAVAVYMDGPNKGQMTPEFYRSLSAAAQGQGGASSGLSALGGDTVAQDISSDDLLSAIADAAAQAAAARAELAQIANDGVLSPSEKPTVIRDYSVITSEQSGIDAKAVQFLGSGSAEQTNYDNAITALTNYLATLTAATAWNDKNGYTDIVSSDFDDNFNNVYTNRQTLLNAIYNAAKGLADNAQTTANTALTTPQTNGNYVTGNPSFTINKLGTATGTSFTTGGQQIVDGWQTLSNTGQGFLIWEAGSSGSSAHPYFSLRSGSIANGATYTNWIASMPNFPCEAGQQFYIEVNINTAWSTNPPTGAGRLYRLGVKWFKGDGTASATPESYYQYTANGGVQAFAGIVTAPSDAATGYMYHGQLMTNSSGATYTITGLPFDTRCTFAAVSTVIPQGKLTPINWMGVRSILNTSPLTYSINTATPAGITFSCAAVTVRGGTNQLVNYNAASASTTQARGTTVTYYFYFIDPNQQGGSQTLQFTTNVYDLSAQDGIVNLGNCSITVPASGGGSGSGGGGGGWCVCDDMWVDSRTQAKDAKPGHVFDCCDMPTSGLETFKRRLQSVEHHDTECVRITTERGAVLDCGITTPFDTVDGRALRAPDMAGELVLTDRGLERVLTVEPIGVRRVCYFHLGGVSYAAGADPCHRIYSHNAGTNPSKP